MNDTQTFEFQKWDDDLAFIVSCLRETLAELGEKELSGFVPWSDEYRPHERLPERAAQVYSLSFQLLNMVEENTANQARRRGFGARDGTTELGAWGKVIPSIRAPGMDDSELAHLIRGTSVEPTLTAHPTEAKRATVLEHYRNLYLLMIRLENQMYSLSERTLIRDELKASLERLLRTGEVYIDRPDVFSELRNVTHYLGVVFPEVITLILKRFLLSWREQGLRVEALGSEPIFPGLMFGNWVGGDRDGHPLVTSEVTQQTLTTLREEALHLQRRQLGYLAGKLSLSGRIHRFPQSFIDRTSKLADMCGALSTVALARNPGEPIRQFINLVAARLPSDPARLDPHHYRSAAELVSDLRAVHEALVSVGATRLATEDLLPAIQIAHTFGFHLARLDIRQNSEVYGRAIQQLMDAARIHPVAWNDMNGELQRQSIERELRSPRPFAHPSESVGAEGDEARATFRVVTEHCLKFGSEGIGSFIVSMTRNTSDLLTVYLLAREAELAHMRDAALLCPVQVVPLFETIDDLEKSADIMNDFLGHPLVARAIQERGGAQDVMIGYSDSNKDGGILASFWGLQKAQHRLEFLAAAKGVCLRFFHGRGGTISRGAGPTDRFLAALPRGSLKGGIKVTEQGETIAQKYANLMTASYNLEVLISGAVRHSVGSPEHAPVQELGALMEQLSNWSRDTYQSLVHKDGFVQFFRAVTPVDIIELSKIGSRPSRRTGAQSLSDLRAIPWVFAWNQSRFFLSGWYGVGTALERMKGDEKAWKLLSEWVDSWAPAHYLLSNVETMLYSASEEMMRLYASLWSDERQREAFMTLVLDEYRRCVSAVQSILPRAFAERRPRMHKTLALREAPLRDLHRTQVALLGEWRHSVDQELLSELLLVTNAIAGGLRTTG